MDDRIKDTDFVGGDEPPPHAGDTSEVRPKSLGYYKSLQQSTVVQWKIDYNIMHDDPILRMLVIPDVFL